MSKPGRLTRGELVEVEPGIFLGKRAARAYRRAKAGFRQHGKVLSIVGKYAAYRTAHIQDAMRHAGLFGPRADRLKYKLNSDSVVVIAAHPYGSHEDGRAMDVLIDGSSHPSSADIKLMAKFGWKRQFGNDDPNHFRHNNINGTTPVTRKWCIANHIWVQPAKKH